MVLEKVSCENEEGKGGEGCKIYRRWNGSSALHTSLACINLGCSQGGGDFV